MDAIKNVLHADHVIMQSGGVTTANGLSLDVNEHEITALIGSSGAGKTTAFNCVTGIYQPTYGSVSPSSQVILTDVLQGKMRRFHVDDVEPTAPTPVHKTPDQITRLGIAKTPQNTRLLDSLTVFENVSTAKHMRAEQDVFSAALRLNHAEEKRMRDESFSLLEMQGLVYLKNETASFLSYGLQRRLKIARVLVTSPSLLFLDEPVAGMNPQETQDLTDFIRQIRDDYYLTIFVIEHHMDLVMQISDRIYMLDSGKPTVQGTPDEVQNNPKVIEAYLGVSSDVNG